MIPKKIFYIWFGKKEKPDLIKKCIESWKVHLSDFEIVEINEDSFNVDKYEFTKRAYSEKKWAFVSDYVRLIKLCEEGGVYLDTDMLVLKSFTDFMDKDFDLILGKEDEKYFNAAMLAAAPRNALIEKLIDRYDNLKNGEYITIPRLLTEIYENEKQNKEMINSKTKVFESIYFYPFCANDIDKFNYKNAPEESYAVHMWNYSWGPWYIKFLKKVKLYKIIIKILEFLNIKNILKKIFKVA